MRDRAKTLTTACAKPGELGRNLNSVQTRLGLRISNWEAVASNIHSALVAGTFLTGFAIAWGADDFQLGLLAALSFLVAPFQWLGAYLVDRFPQRRRELVAWFCLFARAPMALIALFPLFFHDATWQVFSLVLLLLLLQRASANLQEPGWISWMAVLVPRRIRGRYMGWRGCLTESTSMATILIAGWVIDMFRSHGQEREGFAWIQLVAAVAGVWSFVLLLRQPDPGHCPPPPQAGLGRLLRLLAGNRFLWLVAFNGLWLAGLNFCAPFITAHLIKNLDWDFRNLAVLSVIGSVAAIFVNPIWGRMAERYGFKRVLKVCWLGLLSVPLLYLFCPPDLLWPIYLANLVNGIFMAGFSLTIFSLTLVGLPPESQAGGSALLNFVAAPAIFLSLMASGALAKEFVHWQWKIGGLTMGNYHLLFGLSVLMRIPTWFLLDGIDEHSNGLDRTKNRLL